MALDRETGDDTERPGVWGEYRRRRTLAWALPLALIVVAFALGITGDYNGPWLFVASPISLGVLQLWFQHWPCPRCGKPFTEPKRDLTYSEQCRRCGLGLWKDAGNVDAYREKQRRGEAILAAYGAEVRRGKRYPSWREFFRPRRR